MLGTSLRLLMQARVARVLGVLVRNHASVPDAVDSGNGMRADFPKFADEALKWRPRCRPASR